MEDQRCLLSKKIRRKLKHMCEEKEMKLFWQLSVIQSLHCFCFLPRTFYWFKEVCQKGLVLSKLNRWCNNSVWKHRQGLCVWQILLISWIQSKSNYRITVLGTENSTKWIVFQFCKKIRHLLFLPQSSDVPEFVRPHCVPSPSLLFPSPYSLFFSLLL